MQKTVQTEKLSEEKLLSILSEMAAKIESLEEWQQQTDDTLYRLQNGK